MELPAKKYFSLEEVAEKFKCTTSDLLHFGANGKLEIAVYIEFYDSKVQGPPYDDETNVFYGRDGFYYLGLEDIQYFERYKDADVKVISFAIPTYDMYSCVNGNGEPHWISSLDGDELIVNRGQLVIFQKDLQEFVSKNCNQRHGAVQKAPADPPKAIDSLVKMVITMAIKGYQYDHHEAKSKVTSEIVNDAESLGLSLHPDTVRKWLKEGVAILPRVQDE